MGTIAKFIEEADKKHVWIVIDKEDKLTPIEIHFARICSLYSPREGCTQVRKFLRIENNEPVFEGGNSQDVRYSRLCDTYEEAIALFVRLSEQHRVEVEKRFARQTKTAAETFIDLTLLEKKEVKRHDISH